MSVLTHKQISLAEIYSEYSTILENVQHQFLSFFEENLNLNELIPRSFFIITLLRLDALVFSIYSVTFLHLSFFVLK